MTVYFIHIHLDVEQSHHIVPNKKGQYIHYLSDSCMSVFILSDWKSFRRENFVDKETEKVDQMDDPDQ